MSELPLSATAARIRASVFTDLAARIEHQRQRGADLIELHIGDTYRLPPPAARFDEPAAGPGGSDLYRYGSVAGMPALREAFASRLVTSALGPASVDPHRDVLVAAGATHALFCAARAVLEPGDEVLVASPYWPLSVGVFRAAGAVPIEVPLTTALYGRPDADPVPPFARARTERTRALYLITPNNPDGKVLTLNQLARLAEFATAHRLWIIADEVYADYVYDGAHLSIARLEGMASRTLTIYSVSKSHALAGARVGFAVGPERAIALARRVATHTVFNVPVFAQRVALAALRDTSGWLDETRSAYRAVRDDVVAALRAAGLPVALPEGGTYVFVDFAPALGGRPLPVLLARAVDQGVVIAPGDGFGEPFSTFGRICFTACERPRVLEGIRRLFDR